MPQSLKRISLVNESKALPLRRRASLYGDGRMARKVTTWWQKRLKLQINKRWFDKRIGDAAVSNPVWFCLCCGQLTSL